MDNDIDNLRYISIMSMTKYGYPIFNIISENTCQRDIDNLPDYIKQQLDLKNNYYLYLPNPPYGINKILIKITKESVQYIDILTDTINYIVEHISKKQTKLSLYELNQSSNNVDIYIIDINKNMSDKIIKNKSLLDFMSLVFKQKNILISEDDIFDTQPDDIIIFSSKFSIN